MSFPIPSHASVEEPCRQIIRVFQVLTVSLEASNPLSAKEVTGQAIASLVVLRQLSVDHSGNDAADGLVISSAASATNVRLR